MPKRGAASQSEKRTASNLRKFRSLFIIGLVEKKKREYTHFLYSPLITSEDNFKEELWNLCTTFNKESAEKETRQEIEKKFDQAFEDGDIINVAPSKKFNEKDYDWEGDEGEKFRLTRDNYYTHHVYHPDPYYWFPILPGFKINLIFVSDAVRSEMKQGDLFTLLSCRRPRLFMDEYVCTQGIFKNEESCFNQFWGLLKNQNIDDNYELMKRDPHTYQPEIFDTCEEAKKNYFEWKESNEDEKDDLDQEPYTFFGTKAEEMAQNVKPGISEYASVHFDIQYELWLYAFRVSATTGMFAL